MHMSLCGSPLSIQTYLWQILQIHEQSHCWQWDNSYMCLKLSKGEALWQLREQK